MSYEISSKSEVDKYGNMYFRVTFKEDDVITEKRMEPVKFAEILLGSVKEDIKMIESPLVLPECIKKVRMGSDGDRGTFEAVMVFPAQKRGFAFANRIFYIPFPALVMKACFHKGVRKSERIFALKEDNPSPTTALYNYPFGNVYNDGHICFGNIEQSITCVEEVPKLFEAFINGRTNHDLYDSNRRNSKSMSQGEFVQMLEKMEQFPLEELVSTSLKYGDL